MTNQESPQKPQEPCCGPDCGCNAKPASSKGKKVLLTIVLLAVCVILVYKLAFQAEAIPTAGNPGFNTSGIPASEQTNTALNSSSSQVEMLSSMNALNEKAIDKNAVMVWVPSQAVSSIPAAVLLALQSAQQTIQSKGVSLGVYQLQAGSMDQTGMSSQFPLPAVLVLSKGKGLSKVTGEITSEKLLEAYVSSNRTGGCCPSGAGSPSCKPSN